MKRYRRLFYVMSAAVLVLAGTLAFTLADEVGPDPVPLGTGKAGLKPQARVLAQAGPPLPDTLNKMEKDAPEKAEQEPRGEAAGSGEASYYGSELAGRPTASGETFDPNKLTAAHRTLPIGSRVRVTNTRNGRSVVVRINDRGPYAKRRVIDLSYRAARELGMLRAGTAPVRMELLT